MHNLLNVVPITNVDIWEEKNYILITGVNSLIFFIIKP
jgi:hypothetical protein